MAAPVRTCIGCGRKKPKAELVRVVASGGRVEVDPAGSAQGRGAYVCDAGCARQATQKRAFARALKAKVGVDAGLAERVGGATDARPERGGPVDRKG